MAYQRAILEVTWSSPKEVNPSPTIVGAIMQLGLSLHHVLHVPEISYNLLSISKINRDLNCKATFLPDCLYLGLELGEDDWHCLT
ncbi:reverse transcriptase [Cucumis melo var. makuwa]|uniref:Reverse transcriptase n=1 Tax=Cucumis melo var. makuwa TaxID=1194695 RepID=A0A5A7U9H1_CUCMM|nr:reverse transcriptase [Cucumis melo var. makuwa]